MLVQREFVHEGHVYGFRVTSNLDGWEVREDEDSTVIRRVHRDDWHRVERDRYLFEMRARALKREDGPLRARGIEPVNATR